MYMILTSECHLTEHKVVEVKAFLLHLMLQDNDAWLVHHNV